MPDSLSTKKKGGYEDYEIESAADTLVRAKTMKMKEKKLYNLALAELRNRKKAINAIV